MSDMSVSYCGTEIPLADALDQVFTELQGTLNSLHCYTRELGMSAEQDNDYLVDLDKTLQISDGVDEMTELFKELKSVAKQVLGAPSKELKDEAKRKIDDWKLKKKLAKDAEKEAVRLATAHATANS
jgi:hypothetical protein